MYKKTYFFKTSPYDETRLSVLMIVPDTVKGVVQIAHGMAEHKERYLPLMKFLAKHHYATIIHDHRGHGMSVRSQEELGFFNDESAEYIVEDVHVIYEEMKARFSDVPYILFGHSMGSLVVRKFLQKYDALLDGLIVCGAPGNNPLTDFGLRIVERLEKRFGNNHRSKLIEKLSTGAYDRPFEGKHKNRWISANEENVRAFNAHPSDGFTFTLNGYKNLFKLVKDVYTPGNWSKENLDLPILFIAGEDDPVLLSIEKWKEAQSFLKMEGYKNVEGVLFDGMRHEILNEKNKELVYETILHFLEGICGR